jgi:hypothetical protein
MAWRPQSLRAMLPTEEEMKTLRVYKNKNKGDVSRLMPAEQA